MSTVLLRLRAEARSRWRAWATLAVLAGLVGGGTIAALAGARRTETAYGRFLEGTSAFDVLVTNGGTTEDNLNRPNGGELGIGDLDAGGIPVRVVGGLNGDKGGPLSSGQAAR